MCRGLARTAWLGQACPGWGPQAWATARWAWARACWVLGQHLCRRVDKRATGDIRIILGRAVRSADGRGAIRGLVELRSPSHRRAEALALGADVGHHRDEEVGVERREPRPLAVDAADGRVVVGCLGGLVGHQPGAARPLTVHSRRHGLVALVQSLLAAAHPSSMVKYVWHTDVHPDRTVLSASMRRRRVSCVAGRAAATAISWSKAHLLTGCEGDEGEGELHAGCTGGSSMSLCASLYHSRYPHSLAPFDMHSPLGRMNAGERPAYLWRRGACEPSAGGSSGPRLACHKRICQERLDSPRYLLGVVIGLVTFGKKTLACRDGHQGVDLVDLADEAWQRSSDDYRLCSHHGVLERINGGAMQIALSWVPLTIMGMHSLNAGLVVVERDALTM